MGTPPKAEGRYSGVFFEEESGLSNGRRGGVKLRSSRSRRLIVTGVNVAGAELTGVKPPALTGIKPEDVGGGVGCEGPGESSIGMFFILFSNSSFIPGAVIEALRAFEA